VDVYGVSVRLSLCAKPAEKCVRAELVTQLSRMLIAESLKPSSVLEIGRAGDKFSFNVRPKGSLAAFFCPVSFVHHLTVELPSPADQTQAAPTKKAKTDSF
jgi:hypothetical protein